MASLNKQHIFEGGIDEVFRGITAYDQYHKYLPGVTSTKIVPATVKGAKCAVRYELNLVKKFYYVLNMFENEPTQVRWELADSNLMKGNSGAWIFSEKAVGQTVADYSADVKFKGLIPSKITDQVIKANVDQMFQGFQKLVNAVRDGVV